MTRLEEAVQQLHNHNETIAAIQSTQSSHGSLLESQNADIVDIKTAMQSLTKSMADLTQRFNTQTPLSPNNQTSTSLNQPLTTRQPPLLSTPNQNRQPKITLLTFDGTNPHDWIFQANRYFTYYSTPEEQRVELASFHMEGQALTWFQWMHRNNQLPSWPALSQAVEKRFGPPTFLNPQATLFKLKQLTTVENYQATFETLCNRITTLNPESILQCFISGLKPHIQNELLLLKPPTISEAIDTAKLIERKYLDQYKYPYQRTNQHFTKPSQTQNTTSTIPQTTHPQVPKQSIPIKQLTQAEMNIRKQQGLCFNCDEKYHFGHRCKPTHVLMILPDINPDETKPPDDNAIEITPTAEEPIPIDNLTKSPPEISFHALTGSSHPRAIRLPAVVNGNPISILVDSGSTHNYLHPKTAKFLGLEINNGSSFAVTVGNGEKLRSSGCCKQISVEIQGVAAQKYQGNRMLGWREFIDGKAGPYKWKTYKEIYDEVVQVGSALLHLGAKPGSRIGIYGINCPQWIVAMEACNGFSFVCVPLYDTLGSGAVDYIVGHAEIDFVFLQDKKVKQILSSESPSNKRLKSIISFNSITKEQNDEAISQGMEAYSWNDFLKMGKEFIREPIPPRPLDICTIMYTSGTSGQPKGVILTHESHATFVHGVDLYMEQFEDKMTVDDVYLSFLPLAHILDRVIEEYFFHKGASVGFYQGNINVLRDDINELKPTLLAGVPRVFERIHEGILKAVSELLPHRRLIFWFLYKRKLSWMNWGYKHKKASPLADLLAFRKIKARLGGRIRLIISGGAPLSTDIEEFLRVTSCAFFVQGYGLTETCGLSTIGVIDEMTLMGTVGVAAPYTEIRLEEVPEMGYNPLAVPSRGEICVRGKTLFSGYYKDPALTAESVRDGWFHTGDVGEMSPDGVFKVIDRKKNIFKLSQGEYVASEYLEKVYCFAPIIEDIWVYGDSFRSMLVAVVAPHEDNAKKWAAQNSHSGSFIDICALVELKLYILQELKAVAEKNKLRGFEHIRGIVVDPKPFDIERDLVTPTMKKKRGQLLKYYQVEIEKLYKSMEEGTK